MIKTRNQRLKAPSAGAEIKGRQEAAPRDAGDKKKKRAKKSIETYKIYIFKVLKQVHPDIGISSKAMGIMNSFINDIFEKRSRNPQALGTTRSPPSLHGRFKPPSGWSSPVNWPSTPSLRVLRRLPNSLAPEM
ncbi:hypothetical protein HAX54_039269 [Datura stramonium]|uniref:Core Histone H2A/H2B/H3 domain-containing protein n=1 Tax=Datura stramonium TaxID=4076 RepID=A0ABS8SJ53_DATST|nr:hypothetical protein [Datura stramonium]